MHVKFKMPPPAFPSLSLLRSILQIAFAHCLHTFPKYCQIKWSVLAIKIKKVNISYIVWSNWQGLKSTNHFTTALVFYLCFVPRYLSSVEIISQSQYIKMNKSEGSVWKAHGSLCAISLQPSASPFLNNCWDPWAPLWLHLAQSMYKPPA